MDSFDTLLEGSAKAHGHLCAGQVVGVRMAMLGCRLIGLDEPRRIDQLKKLIVFVEMDRCTADAVAYVTGVKLGRRSLKFTDYGIMAATFLNLETDEAYRIVSTEESRNLTFEYAPEIEKKTDQQIAAYKRMPDRVLFRVQKVKIPCMDNEMPGPTKKKTVCVMCWQVAWHGKAVINEGKAYCRPCASGAYFTDPVDINIDEI